MDKNKFDALAISFSLEEIIVLVDCLGAPKLDGISHKALNKLTNDQQKVVVDITKRALIARQMLQGTDSGWQPNPLIYSLLVPCLLPQHSLMLSVKNVSFNQTYSLHSLGKSHVLRWVNDVGNYQFILLPNKEAISFIMNEFVAIASPTTEVTLVYQMDMVEFKKASELAKKQNLAEVKNFLVNHQITSEAAESIADSLINSQQQYAIAAWQHRTDQTNSQFSILATSGVIGSWLFIKSDIDKAPSTVSITPFTSTKMLHIVDKFVMNMEE